VEPKVSVIVPIYNVDTYLKPCIESISGQTMKEIEIILIDDGSSDCSPQICDQLAAEDSRIRVLHQENAGVSAARNLGIQLAQGEWIMFVDGDDWLDQNAIELLYEKSLTVSCEVVAASYYKNYMGRQEIHGPQIEESCVFPVNEYKMYLLGATLTEPFFSPRLFPDEMRNCPFLGSPVAKIYARHVVVDNRIIFPVEIKHSEDRMFNIAMIACSSQICVTTVPIYHYRARASSACNASLEGRYINTNGHALIDYLASYEDRIDKVFIQKYAIDWTYGCIGTSLNIKNGQTLKQLSAGIQFFLEQHPICEQSIRSARYKITSTGNQKLKLWLLKHRMYNAIIIVYFLYYNIRTDRKRLELYP